MTYDCVSCPSFLKDDARQAELLGRTLGTPICARFGHVLGLPGNTVDDNDNIRMSFADACDYHGEPFPATPVSITKPVASGDRDILDAGPTGAQVFSCMGCSNFVKSAEVLNEVGVPTGFCSMSGKFVLKSVEEAKGCAYANPGTPSSEFPTKDLLPTYQSGFRYKTETSIDTIFGATNTGVHDPKLYETDKDVSDEDVSMGIRAWRKISDPEGEGKDVFLPIFDESVFSEEEKLFIPQLGSHEHPELYVDYAGLLYQFAVDSWALDETLCLVGAPGLGKTEFGRWVSFLMQVPFHRFSFSKASEVDDMIGKIMFDPDKGTYWVDGRITRAYKSIGITMLDELNLSPEECKEFLRPMMDNSKQLVLDQSQGEVASRHLHNRIIVSINPPWDAKNLGADEFADAETNRMSFSYVDYPPENVERLIIKQRCEVDGYDIPEDLLTKIVNIGKDIREASAQGTFPGTWGIRQQIKFARKTQFYGVSRAVKQSSLNYYDPNVVDELLKLVATH